MYNNDVVTEIYHMMSTGPTAHQLTLLKDVIWLNKAVLFMRKPPYSFFMQSVL